ncbi:hypothetical protein ACVWZ3_003277 [Bradyrhizobium sp. i1.3.6]
MGRHKAIVLAITMLSGGIIGAGQADAQTFRTYRCADGTQFIVGFYDDDKRAFLQIDGEPVTLKKRLALSGTRYSGGRDHAEDRQDRSDHGPASEAAGHFLHGDRKARPLAGSPAGIKKGRNLVVSTLFQTSVGRLRARGGIIPNTNISVPIWALLRRPHPGGTSCRCRSRRSREAKHDRREGGCRHSGVRREPRGPRQGIGRSLQIRDSDHYSSLRLLLGRSALASMVRPTRSIVVTGFSISAAHPELESAEKEISCCLICRHVTLCIP